jgi:hypothetical protein
MNTSTSDPHIRWICFTIFTQILNRKLPRKLRYRYTGCNRKSAFILVIVRFIATSGMFPFFLAREPQGVLHILFLHSNLLQMNFPYPLVILRHWRDLDAILKHNKRAKKAFAQGLNGGKRSRRTS